MNFRPNWALITCLRRQNWCQTFWPLRQAAAAQVIFSPFIDGSLKLPSGPRLPFTDANLFNQMCQSGAVAPQLSHPPSAQIQDTKPNISSSSAANSFKMDSQSAHLLMENRPSSRHMSYKEVPLPADLSMKNRHQNSRNSSPLETDRHDNNKSSRESPKVESNRSDTPLNLSKSKSSIATTSSQSILSNSSLITTGINGCTNYMSQSKPSYNRSRDSPVSSPPSMSPMISSQLSQLQHQPPPPPSAFFGNPGLTHNQYFQAYNALGMGFRTPHMGHDMSSMGSDKTGYNPFGPLLLPDLSKLTPTSTVTSAGIGQQMDRNRNDSQNQSQNDSNTETIVTCQSKCPPNQHQINTKTIISYLIHTINWYFI